MSGTQEHKTRNQTPLAMYDLTIPARDLNLEDGYNPSNGNKYQLEEVLEFMRKYCKRWCFQLERGSDTGYTHFQCRVSLITKKRPDTMHTWIRETLPGTHTSPTANPTYYAGDLLYVTKDDTKISGPWSDKTDINTARIPPRFKKNITWRMWQQTVLSMIEEEADDRTINVIIDPKGFNGKTYLTMWLMARKIAQRVPPQKDARDIMRMIMAVPDRKCYFIDLPRATSHKDQNSIYAAIEEIKNGYCYDDRYHFKDHIFEYPPHVWVFTNTIPDQDLVSKDRWKFYTILNDMLVPYNSKPIPTAVPAIVPTTITLYPLTPITLNVIQTINTMPSIPTPKAKPLSPPVVASISDMNDMQYWITRINNSTPSANSCVRIPPNVPLNAHIYN